MYNGKRILALIPARSGSKGVRDKNIRYLRGKPLIAYSIEAALETGIMDDVIVSTDSERYAGIARQYGAQVPFLRPAELSRDASLASEYIVYTLETLHSLGRIYDYFALLQPTSPLRTARHILDGVSMAVDGGLSGVVAFSETEHPLEYYHQIPPDGSLAALALRESNRQANEPHYRINGMLYVADCAEYLQTRCFYGPNSQALIIGTEHAIDIDSEFDFELAEFLMERGNTNWKREASLHE